MSGMTEVNDVNIIQKDISELKNSHTTLEQRVNILERGQDKHDQQIISLNNQLNKIEENTTWIKRTITGAIITAVCTGVIGGVIALAFTFLQK
ncbi:hemolysin XhlA family protein [Bacillus altitudinis]|uniref:hemolysin XhlA family protein n=1 Tax=Bacillus TaxID=1386 RepID=UPI0006946126|nr:MULTISPECIES: hemolysin XhlA family protein [Bacillus]KOA78040.1 protein xhlA [Bacillus stratosphericus]MBV5114196.1 hemolysin XhlA family protein [Bacillus altitudinis]MBW2730216.1 hemolysin XhlA family protein [Bacillus altitudinis]